MELRDLRALVKIADSGTLSAAARHLNLTQPALSALVRRLENELDVRLVTRHARGVALTEEGKLLVEKAYGILHDVAEAGALVRELSDEPVGEVTLGLPTTVAGGLLPELLPEVSARAPGIRLHVVEAMSGSLVELLQLGRLDMAILFDVQPMAGLHTEPILMEEPRLLVPPDHPMADRRECRFDVLSDVRLVMPSAAHSIRRLLERMAEQHGFALRVDADIDSLPGLAALVKVGYATVLPTFVVTRDIEIGAIRAVRFSRPRLQWTLHLATRRDSLRARVGMVVGRIVLETSARLVRTGGWPGEVHPRNA